MLFFYNKKMLGETLLITINDSENVTYEYKKNITLIKDENDHLVGLNIFNVENLKLQGEGSIELTDEQKEALEKRLEKNGIKKSSISTIYNPVLTSENNISKSNDGISRFVYVGRVMLNGQKNIKEMICASILIIGTQILRQFV